jgi:transketolase
MLAGHQGLDNLVAIVDRNGLQITGPTEDAVALEPLADRWASLGWAVEEVDGHDLAGLRARLTTLPLRPGRPSVLIARTVKGAGVATFEGKKKAHFVQLTPRLYQRAVADLRKGGQQ